MNESILEQVVANVVETIAAITPNAGYAYAYTVERRKRAAGNKPAPNKVVVFQGAPQADTETTGGGDEAAQNGIEGGIRYWRVPLVLLAYVMPSDEATDGIDTCCNRVAADLEKALMADPQRDDLASDTIVGGYEQLEDEQSGLTLVLLPVDVKYDCLTGDPYLRSET